MALLGKVLHSRKKTKALRNMTSVVGIIGLFMDQLAEFEVIIG
jgi:hypothetical protein